MTRDQAGRTECCSGYRDATQLSRRRLLRAMAGTGAAAVATSTFGDAARQTTFAAEGVPAGGNVLVVLSLRGGIDGLGLVVPHGDPTYYTARPTIAVPRASLVAADAMFGLHPAMRPLEWAFTSGELAAVHAVGLPMPNRSHFAAMELVEDADPASPERRGWVNRMIGLNARTDPDEGVQLGSSVVPTALAGSAPGLAARRLGDVSLVGALPTDKLAAQRRSQLDLVWSGGTGVPIYDAYRAAVRTVDRLAPTVTQPYAPATGVSYPRSYPATDLADAMMDTAQLIKADVGTEVVTIDYGSWDLHASYGTTAWGGMQAMTAGLAGVLDAFLRDLGPQRQRVTVVTISEFGRRILENGSRGLDHGWGSMMLVMGAGVRGGRYYGSWPGLGDGRHPDQDLAVTTDYRQVIGEVVTRRFPDRSIASVFPGLTYAPLGLMT
ncbi:MAG TPA: DUF1501 domain-containing protein [Nocardioidaceae bacterium]|nr:DUF1501 domain-containing protein [Nocardioidaceae bacterium]